MKKKNDDVCSGFSRMLAQEFLVLHRRAREANDEVSLKSLNVIISGIAELTHAVVISDDPTGRSFQFTGMAFDIFCHLAKHPNDPMAFRTAATFYLLEWKLPHAAHSHLERALSLNPSDKTLPMLIEVASLAIKRKDEEIKKGSASKPDRFLRSRGHHEEN